MNAFMAFSGRQFKHTITRLPLVGGLSKPDRILGHCGRETLSARLNEIQTENPNHVERHARMLPSAFGVDSLQQEIYP